MFIQHYIQTFIARLFQGFTTILLPLLFSKTLDKEQFGLFCFILITTNLIQFIIDYGFSIQTVKAVSDAPEKVKSIFISQLQAKNIITMLVCLFTTLYFYHFHAVNLQYLVVFNLILFSAISYSYGVFYTFFFQGLKDFNTANRIVIYSNIIYLLFVLPVYFFSEITLVLLASLMAIGRVFGLIVSIYIANPLLQTTILKLFSVKKEMLNTLLQGVPFALLSFFGVAYFQLDSFFVKKYLGYDAVATYQIGIRLVMIVAFVTAVFNVVALPYFNTLKNDKNALYLIKQNIVDLLTMYGGLVAVTFIVFANKMPAVFGEDFSDIVAYMPFFGLIVLIRNFGSGYSLLLTILDHHNFRTFIMLGACVITIISSILLIPTLQIWGALYVALITLFMINASYLYFVWQQTKKIFISTTVKLTFLFYLIAMFCFYQSSEIFSNFGWFFLIGYLFIFLRKNTIKNFRY